MVKEVIDPDQIEIREIEEADIPGFRECLDSVARERRFLAQLEAPPMEKTREFVRASMERGDIRVVAVDGDNVVGWCDITARRFEGLDHVGELGMGILKEYRGRGIGLALRSRGDYCRGRPGRRSPDVSRHPASRMEGHSSYWPEHQSARNDVLSL